MRQEIGHGACCIKGENGPLRLSVYSDNILNSLMRKQIKKISTQVFYFLKERRGGACGFFCSSFPPYALKVFS